MASDAKDEQVDGRRLRSERSRTAIIEAGLTLQREGTIVPTAQQIADRAGVGIRSFFRHFEDMEAMFVAVDEYARADYEALFAGGDREGSLAERIRHAVERHADAYQDLRAIILGTHAQMWRYAVLRENYARNCRLLRKDLDDWLPELRALPKSKREAVDAIASFEMWHRLREFQNLPRNAAIDIIVDLLSEVIPAD
ncbi:transcriptional regulator [Halioglobus pacificus]|uniref:Transcriptional regulator n=2 Tax=Parahalioglobus pacificus TaxID=930806 RepID=A0A918XCI9_9GAMM|nr:transcriptional regulator [Halioglobus pacificus]